MPKVSTWGILFFVFEKYLFYFILKKISIMVLGRKEEKISIKLLLDFLVALMGEFFFSKVGMSMVYLVGLQTKIQTNNDSLEKLLNQNKFIVKSVNLYN